MKSYLLKAILQVAQVELQYLYIVCILHSIAKVSANYFLSSRKNLHFLKAALTVLCSEEMIFLCSMK